MLLLLLLFVALVHLDRAAFLLLLDLRPGERQMPLMRAGQKS